MQQRYTMKRIYDSNGRFALIRWNLQNAKNGQNIGWYKIITYICTAFQTKKNATKAESLAQQVEHIPFKDGVLGSNPRRFTKRKGPCQNSVFLKYASKRWILNYPCVIERVRYKTGLFSFNLALILLFLLLLSPPMHW